MPSLYVNFKGTYAALSVLPSTGKSGSMAWTVDTHQLYVDTGSGTGIGAAWQLIGGASGAVTSLNSLTGNLVIASSDHSITITPSGTTIDLTGAGGISPIVGSSDVTNQSTSQSPVTLVASLSSTGVYRISYYASQNTLSATGFITVFFTFTWTDSSHTRNTSSVTLTIGTSQSNTFGFIQGEVFIYAQISTAITYESTVVNAGSSGGPPSYDVHIIVESL